MEAPNEIYLQQKKWSGIIDGYYNTPIWEDTHDNIKYIRADLAELTWEDIKAIFRIADNYESELNRPKYLSEGYCKEVLRRFLEDKK